MIACHECDGLCAVQRVPAGGRAFCARCGAFLYRHSTRSVEKSLALNFAALILFAIANLHPFLSLKLAGRVEENLLVSGAVALWRLGMAEVGVLVMLTGFVFPFLTISGMLYILLPLHLGRRPWRMGAAYRVVRALAPWTLLGVFMLAVLIAIIKLRDLATIIPGPSLYAFIALMVVSAAAHAAFDPLRIWPPPAIPAGRRTGATAVRSGLVACHTCALLVPYGDPGSVSGACPRCGTPLHSRKPNSLTRTWALLLTAVLLYIPANVYPVMTVVQFGSGSPNTILSGVTHLIEAGMWGLAMIIFFASFVVPILKLIVLSFLLVTVHRGTSWRPRDRTFLYRVTEAVGPWSMVDIFVVAILAGLVDFGVLSTIRPNVGAAFFGAVVVTTMLAAQCFDPRLIWDTAGAPGRRRRSTERKP